MNDEGDWLGDVIDLQDHSLKGRFKRKNKIILQLCFRKIEFHNCYFKN